MAANGRPGFIASASNLIPLAAGLREGVEIVAWKVEERRQADGRMVATWYLTESAPYMVYAVAVFPNGQTQTMSEVVIPSGTK